MATLNNAPFGKFGTCVPAGGVAPPPPTPQPEMLFHYDATHVYNNLTLDYYGNSIAVTQRSDWTSEVKAEKNGVMWADFYYTGKTVQENNLTLTPKPNTIECLVYPKASDRYAATYSDLNSSTIFLYINTNGINDTTPIPGGVLNRWLHIVYSYIDGIYSVYVNGDLITTINNTAVMRRYRPGRDGYEFGYARGFYGTPPVTELYDEAARWLKLFGQTF